MVGVGLLGPSQHHRLLASRGRLAVVLLVWPMVAVGRGAGQMVGVRQAVAGNVVGARGARRPLVAVGARGRAAAMKVFDLIRA